MQVGQWGVTLNFGKEKKDIQIASYQVLVCSKLFQAHLIHLLLLLWVPGGGIFTLAFAGLQDSFGVLDDKRRLVSEVTLQQNSSGCRKDLAAFQAPFCSCCSWKVDPTCVTSSVALAQSLFSICVNRERLFLISSLVIYSNPKMQILLQKHHGLPT